MSVRAAASDSNHLFPAIWKLTDLEKVEKNGKKVFSCFSCGGGRQWVTSWRVMKLSETLRSILE